MKHWCKKIFRNLVISSIACIVLVGMFLGFVYWPESRKNYEFPNGAQFAVAICDDTDGATLENIKPVYDFLKLKGVISTKTVWPLSASESAHGFTVGESLESVEYRNYIIQLQSAGYEIALHGVSGGSTKRNQISSGLEAYYKALNVYPKIHINHRINKDNLYWGSKRLSFAPLQWLYEKFISSEGFSGEVPGSEYYWLDMARRHIEYSRDFSFYELNLARLPGVEPFYDGLKPGIKRWFHTSDGNDVLAFNRLLNPDSVDRLQAERGYTIIYTHFGKGFVNERGQLNTNFKDRIEDLVDRPVWITTTGKLLALLESQNGRITKSKLELFRLQVRWVIEKLIYGRS
ncbi:hypothetical protein ACVBEJ_11105 [Porticoccus sp. GXU_MW_L64]